MNQPDPDILKQIDAQIAEDAKLNDLSEDIKRQFPDIRARSINLEIDDENSQNEEDDGSGDAIPLEEVDCQFQEQNDMNDIEPTDLKPRNKAGQDEFAKLLKSDQKESEESKGVDYLKVFFFFFSVFMLGTLFYF